MSNESQTTTDFDVWWDGTFETFEENDLAFSSQKEVSDGNSSDFSEFGNSED